MGLEDDLDKAAEKLLEKKAEKHQAKIKKEGEGDPPPAADPPPADPPPSDPPTADPPPADPPPAATEIEVSEDKVTEITEQIKADNEGKSEAELKTLTDKAVATEKAKLTSEAQEADSAKAINEKIAEVKGREENKEKSEDEILQIATDEIRSLNNDDPPPPEPKGPVEQRSINDQLFEKTGGKHTDIDKLIEEAEKPKVELSERIQTLHDLEKSGANVDKVLAFNALNIEALDPKDYESARKLLKIEMKLEDEGMTETDMNYELSKKFNLEYKYAEDDEEKANPTNKEAVDNERRSLIREADKAKARLEETKEKYLLPEPGANSQATVEATRKELTERKEAWQKEATASLKDYEAINVNVEEGTDFRFLLDNEKLTTLKDVMSDPMAKFFARYNKDGKTDVAQMQQDMAMILNQELFISKLWEQAEASGAFKTVKRTANLGKEVTPGGSNTNTDAKFKSPAHAMVEGVKEELGMK